MAKLAAAARLRAGAPGFMALRRRLLRNEGRQAALSDRDQGLSPFGFAGIWENWKGREREWVRTFALLTTPANEFVRRIHDRMSLILKPQDYERWLGPELDPAH